MGLSYIMEANPLVLMAAVELVMMVTRGCLTLMIGSVSLTRFNLVEDRRAVVVESPSLEISIVADRMR